VARYQALKNDVLTQKDLLQEILDEYVKKAAVYNQEYSSKKPVEKPKAETTEEAHHYHTFNLKDMKEDISKLTENSDKIITALNTILKELGIKDVIIKA